MVTFVYSQSFRRNNLDFGLHLKSSRGHGNSNYSGGSETQVTTAQAFDWLKKWGAEGVWGSLVRLSPQCVELDAISR